MDCTPRRANRLFVWSDRSTWPTRYPTRLAEPGSRSCDRLAERLRESYDGVRAYHGCRPLTIDSYLLEGLKLANHTERTRQAVEFFTSARQDLTRAAVEKAADQQSGIDNQRVYACWDDRALLQYCGHYIIRGSEFLQGIAARLHCRDLLEQVGVPTIIDIDVPMSFISDGDLQGLACEMSQSGRARNVPISDGAFTLRRPLPPSTIVRHRTVTDVIDPVNGMRPYRYRGPHWPDSVTASVGR